MNRAPTARQEQRISGTWWYVQRLVIRTVTACSVNGVVLVEAVDLRGGP